MRRFEQPADDPLAAAAAQLEDTPAPEAADTAPTPDEAGGAPELPATQLEDEVPDEGRSGRLLGALRDEVVAFLRAVRAGTISGASGGTQLARLRTRALAFPSGPLQASLLDALALARVALEAGAAPAPPTAPAAPAPPPVAPAAPEAPEVPAAPPPPPLPDAAVRDADDDDEEELADGDEADPIEALVGRASTLFRRRRRNWVLVQWQGVVGGLCHSLWKRGAHGRYDKFWRRGPKRHEHGTDLGPHGGLVAAGRAAGRGHAAAREGRMCNRVRGPVLSCRVAAHP